MSSLRPIVLLAVLFAVTFALAQQPRPALGEPSFSPDGSEIAFVSGGDIWTAPAGGGVAHLLVSHPATESRPLYSPDGRFLAFVSTRTGNGDIYVLELASGALNRLTYDDAPEQLEAWAPDSRAVYFSSSSHDISGMNDLYRMPLAGGTPMPVTAERYTNEFQAAPLPDGSALVFCARGIGAAQWWRNGHSHLDESEIWKLTFGPEPRYQRLLQRGAKQLWPMWSEDGRTLYFMSDRGGHENIWALGTDREARQITQFDSGRVLFPSISRDGKKIVFERDFNLWVLDIAGGQTAMLKVELRGAPASATVEHRKISDQIREAALSPDGKKIAFIVRGEIFAASAKDGGDAVRVTNTPAREAQVVWAPDSRRIAYISDRDGNEHIYLYDFGAEKETQLTRGEHEDISPLFSPDGKMLAFERDRKQMVVLDLAGKKESVVATGTIEMGGPAMGAQRLFDWSPDSRWIAYSSYGDRMFRNVSVVPAGGGPSRPVSFVSNVFTQDVAWSPDGKFLLMLTTQRTEPGQIARIDLLPHVPRFQEDKFRELFKPEKEPGTKTEKAPTEPGSEIRATSATEEKKAEDKPEATKPEDRKGPKARPTQVAFEGIRQRLSLLPVGLDASSLVISADGKWLAFVADAAGQPNIYLYSLDELAKEPPVAKQLTATQGGKSALQFSPDGKELYYLDGGKINVVSLEAPKPRPLAVTAEMDVDFAREKSEAFEQGWRYLRDSFFDEHMNGVNWEQARAHYEPLVAGARNPDEMRRIMSLMIGELNASHMGISGPSTERRNETGRLGLRFDAAAYEQTGKLRVASVVPLGPADIAGIKSGDVIEAIEETPLERATNLDALLQYRIGRKTTVRVASAGKSRTVSLKPMDQGAEKGLLYREWVEANRAYVERVSNGRLGYVHMINMSEEALRQLNMDLDAQMHTRAGVVIDVRNNNGGFVNAYALDVLTRRGYLTMTPRGLSPVPARTVLGQRSLELPTILVTNQHSLSDAEDFTEGYRALGLGKVVGERTAGWIIYTWNVALIDGSQLRLPRMRVTAHDGGEMEMHPRAVDIEVFRPLGESARGVDSQLDAAVRELLRQIDKEKGITTKVAE